MNELPSLCHLKCAHNFGNEEMRDKLFGKAYNSCGRLITFADDSLIILRGLKGEDELLSREID